MPQAPPSRTRAWLVLVLLSLTLLPLLAIMLSRFIPMKISPPWQAHTLDWSLTVTVMFTLLWGALFWLCRQPGVSLGKRVLIWLFAPLLGTVNAAGLFVQTIPLTAALLLGGQVGIIHTVQSLPRDDGKCRKPIQLVGIERLCGYPDKLRAQLAPGMRIVVIGRGTWMGVIPRDVQVLDLARLSRSAPGQPAAFRRAAPGPP